MPRLSSSALPVRPRHPIAAADLRDATVEPRDSVVVAPLPRRSARTAPPPPAGLRGPLGRDLPERVAQGMLLAAGVTLPGAAAQDAVAQAAAQHPQEFADFAAHLAAASEAPEDPDQAAEQLRQGAETLAFAHRVNPWAVVLRALFVAARDAQADQQLRLNKLQMYTRMQEQLQSHGDLLSRANQQMDAATGTGKNVNVMAQVPFPTQYGFGNLDTLDRHGKLIKTNLLPADLPTQCSADQMNLQKSRRRWPSGLSDSGLWCYTFDGPPGGKPIQVQATSLDAAKQKAAEKFNQASASLNAKSTKSMVSVASLAALQTRYSQTLDLLNNKISATNGDLSANIQAQQAQYGTMSSIIKTMGESFATMNRNMLG